MVHKPEALFKYGPFTNVSLSMAELAKLQERFGEEAQERIDAFAEQKHAHGYEYKSDYAAILAWARRDAKRRGVAANTAHGKYGGFVQ